MRLTSILVAFALGGCGVGDAVDSPPDVPDGTPPGDAPLGCYATLSFTPLQPVAKPDTVITVKSQLQNAPGTLKYQWHVGFNGTTVNPTLQNNDTEITFRAPDPGVYRVDLAFDSSASFCSGTSLPINVGVPGARMERVRLHIVAPRDKDALTLDRALNVFGGADVVLSLPLEVSAGMRMSKVVTGPNGPLPAYLRFIPNTAPEAIIEAFSDSTGHATVVLDADSYTVLVVPSIAGAAPRRIVNWSSSNPFVVTDAGTPVSGEVRDPAGAAIGGAKVQLTIDGVPSTLATTAGDGSFQLRAPTVAGAITVDVAPPEPSGLPRLSATSTAFDLDASVVVQYAPSLARRDLAGVPVLRDDAPVGGARVTVTGALEVAGKITTGAVAPVDAAGEVRITARSDASGALPAMLVPAAQLSAVIEVGRDELGRDDLAVAELDTRNDVPESLDAPAMPSIATEVWDDDLSALPGGVLDLVPVGALALAAAPVLRVTADGDGAINAAVAAGGHYDLRFRDPRGRSAPLVVTDRTATTIQSVYSLPRPLEVTGDVVFGGQPLRDASVQALCTDCSGIERTRPLAEAATNASGRFTLVVRDPGTM